MDTLDSLLIDWRLSLVSRNRSAGTVKDYLLSGQKLIDWLTQERHSLEPEIPARVLRRYLATLDHLSPATVAKQYRNLQQFGSVDQPPGLRTTGTRRRGS